MRRLAWRAWATAVALTACGVGSLAAQSTEEVLAQRRLEYQAAVDAYRSALSALEVAEQRFTDALREIDRARRSGDEQALARALPRAQDLSVPKADRERRLQAAARELERTRQALIDVLVVRQAELLEALEAATNAQERRRLTIELEDISNQLQELEAEQEDPARFTVMPEIHFDPRDGPTELRAKAELIETYAAIADTVIAETRRQIASLEARLVRERRTRDLLSGLDRFGDRQVPTGPPTGGARVMGADSTDAGGRPVSLEDRIEELRSYVEELQEYRDQLLVRAKQFRERIRRNT